MARSAVSGWSRASIRGAHGSGSGRPGLRCRQRATTAASWARRPAGAGPGAGPWPFMCWAMIASWLSPVKGGAPGQHFEQDRAQGVDVGARVAALAFDLLGGHVIGGAHRGGQVGVGDAVRAFGQRQAKVHDHRLAFRGDQDVLRLQVAVDHAVLVAVGHAIGDLAHQRDAPARAAAGRRSRSGCAAIALRPVRSPGRGCGCNCPESRPRRMAGWWSVCTTSSSRWKRSYWAGSPIMDWSGILMTTSRRLTRS